VTKDRGYDETEAAVTNRVQRYDCNTLIEAMSGRYARGRRTDEYTPLVHANGVCISHGDGVWSVDVT
jgi:hypothetical protein